MRKRAKVTAAHFTEPHVIEIPAGIDAEALERAAITWLHEAHPAFTRTERRSPSHAHLRELMDAKRALDNAIHAERLRLGK